MNETQIMLRDQYEVSIQLTNVIDRGKFVEAVREDGLKVFFDKQDDKLSQFLNSIRQTGTKQQVVMAVGMVRGLQIAQSYARVHNVELPDVEGIIESYSQRHLNEAA